MNSHLINYNTALLRETAVAKSRIHPGLKTINSGACLPNQRGVVLFFTLVALLAMSLAAVALIRSVDTGSMIAGNLAFKQAATSAADSGIAESMTWMRGVTADSMAMGIKVKSDPTHPLNNTVLADRPGYHSTYDPDLDVTDPGIWDNSHSVLVPADESRHEVRYLIQRLCRDEGVEIAKNDCLLGAVIDDTGPHAVLPAPEYCPKELDCADEAQPAQIRITVRSSGPNNTTSYVQGIVY